MRRSIATYVLSKDVRLQKKRGRLMINMVSVQNLIVPFCGVLGKVILGHFPCLAVLESSSKFYSYLNKTKIKNVKSTTIS